MAGEIFDSNEEVEQIVLSPKSMTTRLLSIEKRLQDMSEILQKRLEHHETAGGILSLSKRTEEKKDYLEASSSTPTNVKLANYKQNIKLHKAAHEGDWKTACSIINSDISMLSSDLTKDGDTVLHVVACTKHHSFLKNLVQIMSSEHFDAMNRKGDTPLTNAARFGTVKIAKIILENNSTILYNENHKGETPIIAAMGLKHKTMAYFLFDAIKFEELDDAKLFKLFIASITFDYYDIALNLLDKKPDLALRRATKSKNGITTSENGITALHVLAKKSPATIGFKMFFRNALMQTLAHQLIECIWKKIVEELSISELLEFIESPTRVMYEAAKSGNIEVLVIILSNSFEFSEVLLRIDDDKRTIFHVAVENRKETVFNLLSNIGPNER